MKRLLCFFLLLTFLVLPVSASEYYYTRQGDSMVKIALHNGVSLSKLRAYNPAYKTGKLQEGTLIYVPISDLQMRAMEKEAVRLVNAERESRGLAPLRSSLSVRRVARMKAQDLCDGGYFDHVSPKYGTPFEMLEKQGARFRCAGENIAMGQVTAQEVVQAWMNSKGHRANILNPNYTKIGVGCTDDVKGPYWVQMFVG